MRLIVGMSAFALGYAMVYYGVVMYRQYIPGAPAQTRGIPFGHLLGLFPLRYGGDLVGDWAVPPFSWGANTSSSSATPTVPSKGVTLL